MKKWLEIPNDLLTTILVGNNFFNILIASLSTNIAERYLSNDALAISVGITTIAILMFGEIAPKTFGRGNSEKFSPICVLVLIAFYFLMWPVVKEFTKIIQFVLGKNANVRGRVVTKDDIEVMVEMAEEERTIDSKQLDLLNSILEFPSIKVKDIMVPRIAIEGLKKNSTFNELIFPPAQFFAFPRCNSSFIYTESVVRDHKIWINAEYLRVAFASGTSTVRIIERK
jgi:putative hemolysin